MGKKRLAFLMLVILITGIISSCSISNNSNNSGSGHKAVSSQIDNQESESLYNENNTIDHNITAFLENMTLEEKAGQMLQVERQSISPKDVRDFFIGSVFAAGGSSPDDNTIEGWHSMTDQFKGAATQTRLGIPLVFGTDAVHGNNNLKDTIIYPHNIGLGASGDSELIGKIASATALELKAAGIDWNFSPCVAVSNDIRWGRTYECFSENPDLVTIMAISYITTLQKNGIIACAKHYVADGAVKFGSGDSGFLMDQGNADINQKELDDNYLAVYREAVNAGVKSIMISFSSINNEKNHGNKYLIQTRLKDDMDFKGIVVSDYDGIHQLKGHDTYDKIVLAVNAGIDVLMEASRWRECYEAIIKAAENGDIRMERINDAVTRILRVKMEMGKFGKQEGTIAGQYSLRNSVHKQIAEEAVAKSLVLLKNSNNVLPLKNKKNIAIIGPASDNLGIQCGGWTKTWQGGQDDKKGRWMSGTTVLDGFKELAGQYGTNIITDMSRLSQADVIVAVLGEYPYAEGKGDDGSLSLNKGTVLDYNQRTLEEAYSAKKPVVVILISGRPRIITDELNKWEGFVEAWLPGTEGSVIAKVLYGDLEFSARLPVTWPRTIIQLPITLNNQADGYNALFPYGYGLSIKN
ncbi:MAG: glycoside hydrolase family 3 domain protein [Eubacterium sp.]|jgi:beta-glucosidase|nr:glycoside hydrolase family 3 domain protein [Eubacterium sp.]